jgi:DNA-binding transcriptional MerR regulator
VEIQTERYDPLLRVGDVARVTGLTVPTVRAEADCGQLQMTRLGPLKYRRFQWSAVIAYCQRLGIRPQGHPVKRSSR